MYHSLTHSANKARSPEPESPPISPAEEEIVNTVEDEIVFLNVGGRKFTTTRSTLCAEPGSMLAAKFSGRYSLKKDKTGYVFLDRSGEHFEHVLNWLRMGRLPSALPAETIELLAIEADYYNLTRMLEAVKHRMVPPKHEHNAFVKVELVMSMEYPGIPHALITDLSTTPPSKKMVPSNSRSSPTGYIYDSQIVITEGLQFLETLGWKVVRFHPELSVTEDKGGVRSYVYMISKPRGATFLSLPPQPKPPTLGATIGEETMLKKSSPGTMSPTNRSSRGRDDSSK